MLVTSIRIHHANDEGQVRATADVVLNGSLSLKGIKIMRGRYGFFLAFPGVSAKSPQRIYETVSMSLRKRLQEEVLRAYHSAAAQPVSLFG